jgi:hypothetical protein
MTVDVEDDGKIKNHFVCFYYPLNGFFAETIIIESDGEER